MVSQSTVILPSIRNALTGNMVICNCTKPPTAEINEEASVSKHQCHTVYSNEISAALRYYRNPSINPWFYQWILVQWFDGSVLHLVKKPPPF